MTSASVNVAAPPMISKSPYKQGKFVYIKSIKIQLIELHKKINQNKYINK